MGLNKINPHPPVASVTMRTGAFLP